QGGGSDMVGYATPAVVTIGPRKQYIIFSGISVLGVDAENGKVLWRFPWQTRYDVNAAVPIVFKNFVFITSGYNHGCALLQVGPGKAEAVWENKEMQAHFNSPIMHKGFIYGTGDPGFLMCLDPKTGKPTWKQEGFEKGGIIAVDGTIIAVDGKNGTIIMAALDPKGYKELGRIKAPLGGKSWTAPIVADGKLIVRNEKAIVCLDIK
ncbi:MAG: PQQ-binding-like beta-propeller repeat protein, partial [Planctomycetes bacterium]|nr:PQQ-binding-like beta-propeller repeat protein [Planctomycetota bacterium]